MPNFRRSPLILLCAALGLAAVRCVHAAPRRPSVPMRSVSPRGDLQSFEKATIDVFRGARDSVAFITTLVVRQDIFSLNIMELPRGAGSGFIWDDKGHIVTNSHVLMGADEAQVTLADGSVWKAELRGLALDKDLAVLKIDAPKERLKPLAIGSSKDLRVGQQVYAIGNPFGLDQTLTTGVISALGREIQAIDGRPIQGVIQTDAAINPGNSGGPLLDSAGRLIGVNTQIYSPSGASAGVGFAVPVDTVNRVVPQIIAFKKTIRPGFGMEIVDDVMAQRLGVTQGVLVRSVMAGRAAARAGLKSTRVSRDGSVLLGDVIVAMDGKPVQTSDDLFKLIDNCEVGDTVTLTLLNSGRRREARATLQELD